MAHPSGRPARRATSRVVTRVAGPGRRVALVAAALTVAAGAAGCSSTPTPEAAGTTTTTTSAPPATTAPTTTTIPTGPTTITMRPVLEVVDGRTTPVTTTGTNGATVVLTRQGDADGTQGFRLGPAQLDSSALSKVEVVTDQGRVLLHLIFKATNDGIVKFNELAATCVRKDPTVCPTGQVALVVDGHVLAAPTMTTESYNYDQVRISGAFDLAGATTLADRLNAGLASGPGVTTTTKR